MTPGAQVAAAIDILAAIDTGERPADDVAADYFRRRRYIGAKDRAQIAGHVYSVLRHRPALDWWIAKHPVDAGPKSRVLAALVLTEGWRPEAVARCCDGDRFRPPPLSEAEERLVQGLAKRTLRHPEMPRAVVNDLPEWLEPYLERVFGKGLEREMAALNAGAPIDLRVNLLKADREAARRALAAEGIAAEPTPWSSIGLRLTERVPLGGLAAVKDGLVEVQDEGSQITALLVDARPGMRVVDFCAGAGGKTLALAAQMANRGKLVACDVSARRLERAARRLRRAGVGNVERRVLASERDKWVKRHAGRFDRVMVDAPCLGTGTWRRNPGDKWRATPEAACRSHGPAAANSQQRRAAGSPGREARLRDLFGVARGERGAGRRLSCGRARIFRGARRACLARGDRRRRAGRRAFSAADPGAPRHRRVLCRHFRAPAMSDRVLILDFGSQVTQLIARRVRESGVYCEIHPYTIAEDRLHDFAPDAVILSGGPASLTRSEAPRAPELVFRLGVPVLGICYGMQTMCAQLGGRVTLSEHQEFGRAFIDILDECALFDGLWPPTAQGGGASRCG